MPKVDNTRKQKKQALIARVKRGPQFSFNIWKLENPDKPDEQIQREYRIWAETWILPDLLDLLKSIPE